MQPEHHHHPALGHERAERGVVRCPRRCKEIMLKKTMRKKMENKKEKTMEGKWQRVKENAYLEHEPKRSHS